MVVTNNHDIIDTGESSIPRDVIDTGEGSIPRDVFDVGEGSIHRDVQDVNIELIEGQEQISIRAQRNEEVEVGVSDIGVNEQTPGSGKDLMGLTKNSCADVVVEKESLFGFDK
ncbi:hypothetical protein Tco_0672376 [Tanacetum coccineum]